MSEPAESFVSRVIANPRRRFFKSSPFKIFFPLKIKYGSGKSNEDFYVLSTFNDLPTFRNVFIRVRSVVVTAMAALAAMITDDSPASISNGGRWGRTSDDYAQMVHVTSLMAYTVGGARHVYVQWDTLPGRDKKGRGEVPFGRIPDANRIPDSDPMM
jgi:hypothetical protein